MGSKLTNKKTDRKMTGRVICTGCSAKLRLEVRTINSKKRFSSPDGLLIDTPKEVGWSSYQNSGLMGQFILLVLFKARIVNEEIQSIFPRSIFSP